MMPPVAHIANQFPGVIVIVPVVKVGRGDQGNVGQVRPAQIRVVEDDNISRLQPLREGLQGGLDRRGHCPQMHGLVRGLGHHFGGGVEQGAGKILPFFHIGGVAGALQGNAHLLGYGDEHILEHFQADGVNGH